MIEKNSGGPAFPGKASINRGNGELQPFQFGNNDFETLGMTLRDYFAAKAITGTLPGSNFSDSERDEYARLAYSMADAMLRAR